MSNLIECATCGYPLTPEERTTLVEVNGKMQRPWVGLTDEDLANCDDTELKQALYWEQILKEKNA